MRVATDAHPETKPVIVHADWLLVVLCVGAITRLTRLLTEDVILQPLRRFIIRHRPQPPGPEMETVFNGGQGDDRYITRPKVPAKDQPHKEDWLVYLVHCRWCASIWIAGAVTAVVYNFPHAWWVQIPLIALTASLAAGLSGGLE